MCKASRRRQAADGRRLLAGAPSVTAAAVSVPCHALGRVSLWRPSRKRSGGTGRAGQRTVLLLPLGEQTTQAFIHI